MKNFQKMNLFALSLSLIASCSNVPYSQKQSSVSIVKSSSGELVRIGPEIPFIPEKAFYPLTKELSGVYYSWDNCNMFGFNCKHKEVVFKFEDKEIMKWFKSNDFGLCKRPNL